MKPVLVTPKTTHFAAITDPRELPKLFEKIRAHPDGNGIKGYRSPSWKMQKLALELNAHVFLRSGELLRTSRCEIDKENAVWTIPAARMKGNRPMDHIIPLSHQAVDLIERIEALNPIGPYLFPSRTGTGTMAQSTLCQFLGERLEMQGTHTVHGFRSTASTNLNEAGVNSDWVEMQLYHVEENKVRGAYNCALYLRGRTKMMQFWSDWLDAVVAGTKPPVWNWAHT